MDHQNHGIIRSMTNIQSPNKAENKMIPNTTMVPNVIFDVWQRRLSLGDFSVLCCLCRKTYGWHKDFDRISLRQIENMTGLSKSIVIKAITSLVDIGLVTKIRCSDEYGDKPSLFQINTDCPLPEETGEIGGGVTKIPGGVEIDTRGGCDKSTRGVSQEYPQKKDHTKEKEQEHTPTPQIEKVGGSSSSLQDQKRSKAKPPKEPAVSKVQYLDHVFLTPDEQTKLLLIHGQDDLTWMTEVLDAYIGSSGKTYISHYAVMKKGGWVATRLLEQKQKIQKQASFGISLRQGRQVIDADKRAVSTRMSADDYFNIPKIPNHTTAGI